MKKLKAIATSLCLVVALGLAIPTVTKADDSGPQGASKSTTPAPPPPAPNAELLRLLIMLLMWLFG
jgi:hypothetical protein